MKILLLGKNGQVGWELQRSLALLGELIAIDFDSADHCGDFTNLDGLANMVRVVRPDVIVNAGAHTAVDKAEAEPDLVRTINALAPGILAREAAAIGALLVHYSTDYVFDGSGITPWTESDAPNSLNVYGSTKLEGEQLIAASGCAHFIFRTSWVYAARGGNFAKTMLKLAQERETLKVINDQFGAPTGAELLADATAHAVRLYRSSAADQQRTLNGIYHVVAGGSVSWFDYAKSAIAFANNGKFAIKIIAQRIEAVGTDGFPTAAPRPKNSRLNTTKFQTTFGLELPHWEAGVHRMLTEHLQAKS